MAHAKLFTPFRVGELELANRIVIAPMCQYSAENGCMTDWYLIHLGQLALSGAALLTIEATGDYEAAKAMMAKYVVIRPEVQKALDRLKSTVPNDIRPSFVTAASLTK